MCWSLRGWNCNFQYRKPKAWLMSWLLAAALLLVQTMGLMHGVLLGPKSADSDRAQVSMQRAQQPVADGYGAAGQWVNALFSSHRGDNDCRLFVQASHGSLAPKLTALAPPVVLPSFAVAIFQCEALARWAALFDARGPPLTR